ncbi:hypothetical protein Acsp02_50280 [Actinoplanes sp. NBRC 103695]|nr:hypothetical protein [Actinoplanes sp. NBRC 103695]GLY97774.1 hypothetical protein Acsp02_50280 [Actinoplanes sp. NBRC 103695]
MAALRARDADRAEAVMHAHLLSARASLLGPRQRRTQPTDRGDGLSDCTERQPAGQDDGLAGEGRERMPMEARA